MANGVQRYQRNRSAKERDYPEMSWRIPRQVPHEHPSTIANFRQLPQEVVDETAFTYRSYLELCDANLKDVWMDNWSSLYAVGPFLGRKRPSNSLPFVLVAAYRSSYRNLLELSQALAEPYLEFGILPNLHILHVLTVDELEETDNERWHRTKLASVKWDWTNYAEA